jgi:hypothetical protein
MPKKNNPPTSARLEVRIWYDPDDGGIRVASNHFSPTALHDKTENSGGHRLFRKLAKYLRLRNKPAP